MLICNVEMERKTKGKEVDDNKTIVEIQSTKVGPISMQTGDRKSEGDEMEG